MNHPDGITSGGNQFKVNEHGVILGNVGTGGSINVSLSQILILLPLQLCTQSSCSAVLKRELFDSAQGCPDLHARLISSLSLSLPVLHVAEGRPSLHAAESQYLQHLHVWEALDHKGLV